MTGQDTESRAAFARRIRRSKAYVTKLITRGLPLTADGKQVLIEAALTWLDGNVASHETAAASAKTTDLNAAKTQLALIQAERTKFALEVEKGRYVLREDVKRAARSFGRAHRDAMLGFANRFGPSIAARIGCDPVALIGELEARMREALLEAVGIPVPFNEADSEDQEEAA